ncbi:C40 family peptidase [Campylobacter sp. MIT 21-1685]|uniref:C40 family peptidase n=1 Tax=unclassified Campylobacter TaxID=2593542 RepID=UPI00224B9C09|nr:MULTISPECIES: C40 family peptidase [unclassified Campylobacter]MCX2682692.1 C40 family peptidase [Campylobacter sp. MIT 21-1684]MCX2750972.1 C40 family peptidase [Campylobacter sp. MIT 21-1682]MCX2807095.1 C40 family peptidase [Campylobacter sp. MIT 21-1685]
MMKIFLLSTIVLFFSACALYQNTSYNISLKSLEVEEKLKKMAKEWSKTPYVLGGMTKKGADCSAFTQNALYSFKISIPRTTVAQLHSGLKISKSQLQSGDLVFFKTGRGPNGLHVGIYTSENKFIHLSVKGGVREVSLENSYWKTRYLGARRFVLKN